VTVTVFIVVGGRGVVVGGRGVVVSVVVSVSVSSTALATLATLSTPTSALAALTKAIDNTIIITHVGRRASGRTTSGLDVDTHIFVDAHGEGAKVGITALDECVV